MGVRVSLCAPLNLKHIFLREDFFVLSTAFSTNPIKDYANINNMENQFNYKDINFRLRRNGWFGALLLCLIGMLVGFVCFIECYLVPQNNGLTQDLSLLVPFFYGLLSLAVASCWTFIIVNNFILLKTHKEDIIKVNHLYWMVYACFVLPLIFGFVGSQLAYSYHTGGRKKEKKIFNFKKAEKTIKNDNPANTPYEYKGKWYYYNENNEYFTAGENNDWVSCPNPHSVSKKKNQHLYFDPNPKNTPYELNGKWYYYDDNYQYYTQGSDNQWVPTDNPHIR